MATAEDSALTSPKAALERRWDRSATLFLNNFASNIPLDLRSGTWYFGHALFGFGLAAVLAVYGFRIATAGQPVFGGLLEE